MKVIKCWELGWSDNCGGFKHHAYLANRKAANEWKKQHVWGSIREKEIVILDDLQDLEDYNNKTLREQALAKLSPEERKALGL